jgi:plasmid stabilization system protein ParE
MSLVIVQWDGFWADLRRQVDWYRDNAASGVAERYVDAIEATLQELAETPGIGRPRFMDWPELAGIRSWRVQRPYHRHLIFYRFDDKTLFAERILHAARDLPRRLLESPYEPED